MYDFAGRRGRDTQPDPLPTPSWLLTACEPGRVSMELPASLLLDTVVPAPDLGRGRPVLVLPGFPSADSATRRCRAHLDRLGYRAHGWGLGRNHGLTDEIIDGVLARLDAVHERYEKPVSVVGWSFGGLL